MELKLWQRYWSGNRPDTLEYPFDEFEGALYSKVTGDILREPKVPLRTVASIAQTAMDSTNAELVRKWEHVWGMSVAISFPGNDTSWFLADDFEFGRFGTMGVKNIQGIAFGRTVSIFFEDVAGAARFALSYGMAAKKEEFFRAALADESVLFPVDKRTQALWRVMNLSAFSEATLAEGLRDLQAMRGVDPDTVLAATKTVDSLFA